MKLWITGLVVVAALTAAVVVSLDRPGSDQRADFVGQGGTASVLAEGGAQLIRRADGLQAHADVPTPQPGSYSYPSGDMVPEGRPVHPDVLSGSAAEPEVFTLWMFIFNHPQLCTESACDVDDIGADSAALGGVYQVDGRVADGDRIVMSGTIRLGQPPVSGAVLANPIGSEVHLAIAPHGKALSGIERMAQLNSPLGNPSLWWAAPFPPGETS